MALCRKFADQLMFTKSDFHGHCLRDRVKAGRRKSWRCQAPSAPWITKLLAIVICRPEFEVGAVHMCFFAMDTETNLPRVKAFYSLFIA